MLLATLASDRLPTTFLPAPAIAEPNGICIVNPSPLPTVGPNVYAPVLPACNASRQLITAGTGAARARTGTNGSITSGGASQTWAAAGAISAGCLLQNTSTGPEYFTTDGTAASALSFYLAPNGVYTCESTGVPTAASNIEAPTTGQTYRLEVW